jgi:hypothetical protein
MISSNFVEKATRESDRLRTLDDFVYIAGVLSREFDVIRPI